MQIRRCLFHITAATDHKALFSVMSPQIVIYMCECTCINPCAAGTVYTVSSMFHINRNKTKFDKAVLVDA